MINRAIAKAYCRDDISKIENYNEAVNDPTQSWHIHHRNELTLVGEFAHTAEDLQRMNMYYNRPSGELIFLTKAEHSRIHANRKALSHETRKKLSNAMKVTRAKMHNLSKFQRKKIADQLNAYWESIEGNVEYRYFYNTTYRDVVKAYCNIVCHQNKKSAEIC